MPTLLGTQATEGRFWFALQVKSRHEKVSAAALHNRGYEHFLPIAPSRRLWSDRVQTISLPLFAGYVFCRFAPSQRVAVLGTPGVFGVVCAGKIPAPIHEEEIAALQTVVRSRANAEPCPFLTSGLKVRIAEGPLRGLHGILVKTKQQHRLVLSVTMLQRSVSVEIDSAAVEQAA